MAEEDPADGAAAAAEAARGTLIERLGIEWLEIGPERVVARMPVEGNTQPYGLLHGGATATLCESIASFGAAIRAGGRRQVVGIELNVNHLRGVREGHVTATGVPVHAGRTTAVWDVRVHDDSGSLVAVSRLTLILRNPPP
ncbi:MAG: PaaI family thioesterase [Actinobacteria bacterium]|nr:PaaI family thioesterase [Actinomycetota bacterium]